MSVTEKPTLAIIIGSIRPDRFGPTPASWLAEEAQLHGSFDVDVIDLGDYALPMELAGDDPAATPPAGVLRLGERLAEADAFVLVTPVYNRSYSAALKTAIDWFYAEWALRPVSFVSYGGNTGGLTSIEHLRGIFPEFPAVTVKNFISLPEFWTFFDPGGLPTDREKLRGRAAAVLDELAWWAPMLREARASRPYPGLNLTVADSEEGAAADGEAESADLQRTTASAQRDDHDITSRLRCRAENRYRSPHRGRGDRRERRGRFSGAVLRKAGHHPCPAHLHQPAALRRIRSLSYPRGQARPARRPHSPGDCGALRLPAR